MSIGGSLGYEYVLGIYAKRFLCRSKMVGHFNAVNTWLNVRRQDDRHHPGCLASDVLYAIRSVYLAQR